MMDRPPLLHDTTMNTLSRLATAVLASLSLTAHADDAGAWFGSQKMLACGTHAVEVVTTCAGDAESDVPNCFKQVVTFGNLAGTKHRTYTIRYDPRAQFPELIVGAVCVPDRGEHYVLLTGTNFGNCTMGCEWRDLFREDGEYLGSTVNLARSGSFKRRVIDKTKYPLMDRLHARIRADDSLDAFEIARAPGR